MQKVKDFFLYHIDELKKEEKAYDYEEIERIIIKQFEKTFPNRLNPFQKRLLEVKAGELFTKEANIFQHNKLESLFKSHEMYIDLCLISGNQARVDDFLQALEDKYGKNPTNEQKETFAKPFMDAMLERIFANDKFRTHIENKAKLTRSDVEQIVVICLKKVSSEEYLQKIVTQSVMLTQSNEFFNSFYGENPKILENLLRTASGGEDYDIKCALNKFHALETFPVRIYFNSDRDYLYGRFALMKSNMECISTNEWKDWTINLVGICVGPLLFEWNQAGVIIPRLNSNRIAKCSTSIGEIKRNKAIDVAKYITDWNAAVLPFDRKKLNSYHFTMGLLDVLGLKTNFLSGGPLDRYSSRIREGNLTNEIIFYDMKGEEVVIKNHNDFRHCWDGTIRVLYPDACRPFRGQPQTTEQIRQAKAKAEYEVVAKSVERLLQIKEDYEGGNASSWGTPVFGDFTGKV